LSHDYRPMGRSPAATIIACLLAALLSPLAGRVRDEWAVAAAGEPTAVERTTATRDATPGRWMVVPPSSVEDEMSDEREAELERLRSIGYLTGSVEAPERSGVTIYDAARTSDGLNFYTSGHMSGAVLMDMDGSILHEWECSFTDAFPEMKGEKLTENSEYWRYAHLMDNGDVIAIFESYGLVKLDSKSNLLWAHLGGNHHDLEITEDGDIHTLSRVVTDSSPARPKVPLLEDFVAVLGPGGKERERVSILEALMRSEHADVLDEMTIYGDVFHTNSIDMLSDGMVEGLTEFSDGRVLLSLLTPSLLAVIDMDERDIVWTGGGTWVRQHDAEVLDNGTILLFDNEGNEGMSRLLEFDPVTGERVWQYAPEVPEEFFTRACGAAQRLPNGNTLAVESDRGRVFEVTPDGEIVWEYVNPARAGEGNRLIATVFDMARLPADFPTDWLE